jgi:hypothetical protein
MKTPLALWYLLVLGLVKEEGNPVKENVTEKYNTTFMKRA